MPISGIGIANAVNAAIDYVNCEGSQFQAGERQLDGCMARFGSGEFDRRPLRCGLQLPESGWALAPWVEVTYMGSGSIITVGNNSSPSTDPANVACIKSFEFGHSDGMAVRVVVHDEQGGSFFLFMQHVLKHYACLAGSASILMRFRFGWVKSGCGVPVPTASSPCSYAHIISIETNYVDGKFIYELTGHDMGTSMLQGGVSAGPSSTQGGQGQNEMSIIEAVTQLMTSGPPPNYARVRFCKEFQNGNCVPLQFAGFPPGQVPRGQWAANGRNKLETVRSWLSGFRTQDNRGFRFQNNPDIPGGEFLILENRLPNETQPDSYWDSNCVGIYIVNGGARSPVLEFNPKINWDFARLTSVGGSLAGQTLNALQTEGSTTPGRPIPTLNATENPGAGHTVQTITTENHRSIYGRNATVEANRSYDANIRALRIIPNPIEADLVVTGNPLLMPTKVMTKNVTIVFINPFFINVGTRSPTTCGEWMAKPTCNQILSNNAWMIKSVTHRIDSGKYTTTLGLFLASPGEDVPAGSRLGASVSGWTPPVC